MLPPRRHVVTSLLAAIVASPLSAQQRTPLTIDRLVATPSLTGTPPSAVAWSPDSRHVAFLWNDRAMPVRDLWVAERTAAAPTRLVEAGSEGSVATFAWSPDAGSLYFLRGGDIWQVAVGGGRATRLTSDGASRAALTVSPDGSRLAYLRDGDLWTVPSTGGSAERLTNVAVAPIGTLGLGTYDGFDVEVGTATWGGDAPPYAWSPDSRSIALHIVDRRAVRTVPFPYYLGQETSVNTLRRSYPGDPNEARRIALLDVESKRLTTLDLPDPASVRIVDYSWSPRGELLVDRESDDAIGRWLHIVPAGGTAPRLAWHDRRETRIYNDIASSWHPDGRRILITGDLDDRYRLYAVTPGDASPKPLTSADADVAGGAIALPRARAIVYLSSAPSPYERHAWRIDDNGGNARRLTSRPGMHTPFVSPDGATIAYIHTDDVTPPELWLADGRTGAGARRLTTSPAAEFATHPWVRGRYVSFPSKDGAHLLHARILLPPGLDSTRRYPVLFGPVYSNTVRNRWAGLYGSLQQLLAIEREYIVVQVDVRGSTGYGRPFREAFLMDWGGEDLDDLESAVQYMRGLPYVDAGRMGIWGSSYGGTLTVYSLLKKPGVFAAGVAGAPATDPHFFGSDDVAIARRPQTHPQTFLRGAKQYAAQLRDHLLIIHGMQDDVVPFKTSVDLAEELMRQGKDFDFAFAPAATHGWTQRPYYARFLLTKLVDHFDRWIGAGRADGGR